MTDTTDTVNQSAIETLVSKLTQLWWRAEASIEKFQNSLKMNTQEAQELGAPVARGPTKCTDNSVRGADSAHVNVNRIEIGERTLSVIAIVLAAASIMGIFWAVHESSKADREARMLQYYVLEMDAKLIAAGVKKPEDAVANKLEK